MADSKIAHANEQQRQLQLLRQYYKLLPVGYGFRPTDVELLNHYLRRKNLGMLRPIDEFFLVSLLVDVYNSDPWDLAVLAGKSLFQSGDSLWYFFSPKKYCKHSTEEPYKPTEHGVWVLSGKERDITQMPASETPVIGKKRTLIFYPRVVERDTSVLWAIHEYSTTTKDHQDDYVLCRLLKKPAQMLPRKDNHSHNNMTTSSNNCHVSIHEENARLNGELVTDPSNSAMLSLHQRNSRTRSSTYSARE